MENSSFGQIFGADKPDYSAASWGRTGQDAKQTWLSVGRDVAEGPMGVFGAADDQVFGPEHR